MSSLFDVPCTKCHLYLDASTVKVPSRGSDDPSILFIGEAPGKQEDRRGSVFIGPAGQKLDKLMKEARIDPQWCRWTNCVRCIPKKPNKIGVRPPTFEEMEACRDYLEAEILATNPVFLVPLGATAIKALLPKATSVKGVRGKRHVAEFPSVRWRYERLRKWLRYKGLEDKYPTVYVESKMEKQLEVLAQEGFPTIPTRQFTVWPTYHPSAILRGNFEAEQYLVEDLSYLKFAVTGDATVPWEKYKLLQSVEVIKATFEHIKQLYHTGQIPYVVTDTETTTLKVYLCPFYELLGFSLSWGKEKAVFVPFNHPESPFHNDKIALQAIVELTNDLFEQVPIVGHNIKYDYHAFERVGIHPNHVYDDTYLGSWTLFNDTCNHALDALTPRFTGMLAHKEDMQQALRDLPQYVPLESRYHREDGKIPRFCIEDEQGRLYRPSHMGDISLPLVSRYCCGDSDASGRLQVVFEEEMRKLGLWEPHKALTVSAIIPTARMEQDGIRINIDMFEKATKDYEAQLQEHVRWFEEHGYLQEAHEIVSTWLKKPPKEAKLTSDNIKRAIVYDILGFPVTDTTETGKPSVAADTLKYYLFDCLEHKGKPSDANGYYSHRIEALNHITAFNKEHKIYSSYLKPIPTHADDNGIGHTSLGIRTTDTGRYNCKDPSWHTIPWHSVIKKAIEPVQQNGLIMVADYSQVELRILAMVTQDARLLQAFAEGKDMHRFTASLCYDRSEEDVTKAQRRNIKAVNFGIVFGRGAPAIAVQLNISTNEAQDLIDLWMSTFPTVARWIEKQHDIVQSTMEVWTASGFRRIFQEGFYNEGQLNRRAQNTPIQGPASDATSHAMKVVQNLLDKVSLTSHLWVTIHDSLCFSVSPGELYPVAVLANKSMVDLTQSQLSWLRVPMQTDFEVGVTWGELMEMKLLSQVGYVELDGKTEYYQRFTEQVMMWDRPPELLSATTHIEEDDDGTEVEFTKSVWNLAA